MFGPNPNPPPAPPDFRYASIDIETLGLSSKCSVIEFGAVLDDLKSPIDKLPKYHCYVTTEDGIYIGEPYAMSMHSKILKRIADREEGFSYIPDYLLEENFISWLNSVGDTEKLVVAGKNFQSFDMKFLSLLGFGNNLDMHHRGLDPGSMFYDPRIDKKPPGLDVCLKRAGIEKNIEHTAVADAIDVIRCIRYKYGIE